MHDLRGGVFVDRWPSVELCCTQIVARCGPLHNSCVARINATPRLRSPRSAGSETTEITPKLENKVENKNCRMRVDSPIFYPLARLAKPLYGLTPVPRVRIPPSPPSILYGSSLNLLRLQLWLFCGFLHVVRFQAFHCGDLCVSQGQRTGCPSGSDVLCKFPAGQH